MTPTPTLRELVQKIWEIVKTDSLATSKIGIPTEITLENISVFLEKQISEAEARGFTQGWCASHEHDAGIEKLVYEAREDEAKKMKEKCLAIIPNLYNWGNRTEGRDDSMDDAFEDGTEVACKNIRNSIQSL